MITENEEVILEILEEQSPQNMQQILKNVKQKKEWSDSTIKTFVRRLVGKGAVKEEKKEVLYYSPTHTKEMRGRMALKAVIDKFYKGYTAGAILHFVENQELSKEELEEIRKLIDRED